MTKIYETYSEEETFELGRRIGEGAIEGQIYCLDGDLGTGKTVISKGIAKGIGITSHVTSPTFTIINVYDEGRMPFYHFDVYRISDPYEMDEIGYEEYFFGHGITLVEWSSLIEELLPASAIKIKVLKDLSKGLDYRRIIIEGSE